MNSSLTLFWFRQDLRLSDNAGLWEASQNGPVLPIYIFDDAFEIGRASKWWLHHSLEQLNASLNGHLNFYLGNTLEIITQLVEKKNIHAVYSNHCYEPLRRENDLLIEAHLKNKNIECHYFNSSLLWKPGSVLKADRTPYKVFTPFYRQALATPLRKFSPSLSEKTIFLKDPANSTTLDDLKLLPRHTWYLSLEKKWNVGEQAAHKKLHHFLKNNLENYQHARDYPNEPNISGLSPHLHFGEISPNQIWHATQEHGINRLKKDADYFLRELVWREFSYSLLAYFPELPWKNFQEKFDRFPWEKSPPLQERLEKNDSRCNARNEEHRPGVYSDARGREHRNDATTCDYNFFENALRAWQQGKTGYPIVDAGMRELWQTGTMHNRVRMIVASFLTKNLLIHWHEGAAWFLDCLVDADLASNSMNWQWVAGCGVDAAPYFRIFNPVLQGEKFDPLGKYTTHFVPELKLLPKKFLFKPWTAPEMILNNAGVVLGKNYPKPIVDLQASRNKALDAYHHQSY